MKCQAVALALMATVSIGAADPISDRESQDIAREIAEIRRLMTARGVQPQPGGKLDQLANVKGRNATDVRRELEQIRRGLQTQPAPAGNMQRIGGGSGGPLTKTNPNNPKK